MIVNQVWCIHIDIYIYVYVCILYSPEGPSTQYLRPLAPNTIKGNIDLSLLATAYCPDHWEDPTSRSTLGLCNRPPNVPPVRALWSLSVGIWGLLQGSCGVQVIYTIGVLQSRSGGSTSRIRPEVWEAVSLALLYPGSKVPKYGVYLISVL